MMHQEVLQIKNMVCDRCLLSVSAILSGLKIPYHSLKLGEVTIENPLEKEKKYMLQDELKKVGFSLIEDKSEQMTNKIKSLIIEEVYGQDNLNSKKLPDVLVGALMHDYSYISALFKKVEGLSIEKFRGKLRIERTKELLEYGELNINEIAAVMGYKSVSYFCSKFKRETGFTPLSYKKNYQKTRVGINNL